MDASDAPLLAAGFSPVVIAPPAYTSRITRPTPGTLHTGSRASDPSVRGRDALPPPPARPEPPVVTTQPASSVPEPVRVASEWSWRAIVIAIAVGALVIGLVQLKTVVVPVLVAALLAALLSPVAGWLHVRAGFPK